MVRLALGASGITLATGVPARLTHVQLPDVGHYVALEAPGRLAEVLLPFFAAADSLRTSGTP